ncbi:MAG TPA: FtsX-like permease family protein [Candidatus Saccharimonadaceae bacterium]|nr:FtsX-like permease family protein [Candidatus Saccharimonadaceae bacterium]
MKRADPLRPTLYLSRRLRRVAPSGAVVALVTALLVLVITPTNTFLETTRRDIAPLEAFTVVSPIGATGAADPLAAVSAADAHVERAFPARAMWVRHPMLVGDAFCALLLVDSAEIPDLLARLHLELSSGHLPDAEHPGVVLHEDVARARGLKIGDRFGSLVNRDDTTPGAHPIVGLLSGAPRIALGDEGADAMSEFLMPRATHFVLVIAKPGEKEASDAALHAARSEGHEAFEVIDDAEMRARADKALANLPVLIGFVSSASAAVVALVVALLAVIAFQGRHEEFAILLAIGHTPRRLVTKLTTECAIVTGLGWLIGVLVALAVLAAFERSMMAPRGLVMRVWDARPLAASLLVPVASVLITLVALGRALRTLDPIEVVQRRGG